MKTFNQSFGIILSILLLPMASASAQTPSTSSGQATAPATQPLRPANGFIIGVFSQPLASFPTWTSQGVNTFVQWEQANQPEQWWAGLATEAGASTIRVPVSGTVGGATPEQWEQWDATYAPPAGGIAWALPDEPDGNGTTPAALAPLAAQFRANPRKLPVWLNVRGGSINGMQPAPSPIAQYLATADWVAEDFYPITGWGDATKLLANGQILDQLSTLAPNKPKMCFVECSDQCLSWIPNHRCVTSAEFRVEVWDAVIHGSAGILYFPQQIGNGFQYDARPANIVAEMRTANALLKDLVFESGTRVTAPAPFESCLRIYKGAPTFITLNTSASAAVLPSGVSVPAQSVVFTASNPFAPASPTTSTGSTSSPQAISGQAAPAQQSTARVATTTPTAMPTPTQAEQIEALQAQVKTLTALAAKQAARIVALEAELQKAQTAGSR